MTGLAVWQIEQHRPLQVVAPIAVSASSAPATPAPVALESGVALQTTPQGASAESELQVYFDRTYALLGNPAGARYTLQLAAIARDVNGLGYLKFAGQHVDPALLYAQVSTYNDRNFVAVYFGSYSISETLV